MKPIKKLLAVTSLSLALALSACGGGGEIDEGQILVRGISANPDTVDPHKAAGRWENDVIGDMFIGLFTDAPDGTPTYGMATSHTVSEDGLIWTFELREAQWSDGTPVTAADFEFAFQRILDPNTIAQYASLLYPIQNAQAVNAGDLPKEEVGVRAIDADTLEITLEYPAPYLPGLLKHYTAFPVPKHVVEVHGDQWTRPENMVTNGPYDLVQWRTGDFLHVTQNPYFWEADDLCFTDVYYRPIADADAVRRLVDRGQLDINNDFPGQKKQELMEELPGWVRTGPYLTTTYYVFNNEVAPFDDVRVRQALGMALDRSFIVDEVLKAGQVPAYAFVPPGIANYPGTARVPWESLTREERMVEARRLLEEVGFGPDNPLTFNYIYRSTGDNPQVAPVVQANWRDIADWVRPEIQQVDTRVLYNRLRQGDFEVSDAGWIADYNDAQNFLYLLESRSGPMNYGNYNNPVFDGLVDQSNRELDMQVRGGILTEAEQIILDEMPIIPMWVNVTKNLVNPNLTGFETSVEDIHRTRYMCRAEQS